MHTHAERVIDKLIIMWYFFLITKTIKDYGEQKIYILYIVCFKTETAVKGKIDSAFHLEMQTQ